MDTQNPLHLTFDDVERALACMVVVADGGLHSLSHPQATAEDAKKTGRLYQTARQLAAILQASNRWPASFAEKCNRCAEHCFAIAAEKTVPAGDAAAQRESSSANALIARVFGSTPQPYQPQPPRAG